MPTIKKVSLCVFCACGRERLPIYLPICLSVCLSVSLSVCLCRLFHLFNNRADFCESLFSHYIITERPICLCSFAQVINNSKKHAEIVNRQQK